jgi:hypothetical protein
MLIRRSAGGGICYLESVVNTKSKAKAADNFKRIHGCCIQPPVKCYTPPTINGGNLQSLPTYFINGGIPMGTSTCYVDGNASKCYALPILTGGIQNSTPVYFINGGMPLSVAICNINQ